MRILALDQAKEFGWSLFDDDELITYDVRDFGCDAVHYDDILFHVIDYIDELINVHSPDLVIIEDIQYQNNQNTYKKLAWLQGSIICYLKKRNLKYDMISPATWRRVCEIKGKNRREHKAVALDFVNRKFGLCLTNNNASDAICIGVCAGIINKNEWGKEK